MELPEQHELALDHAWHLAREYLGGVEHRLV
jgi:hypothetical protein